MIDIDACYVYKNGIKGEKDEKKERRKRMHCKYMCIYGMVP